ncbi:YqaA family protein [Candidatus Pelagibacter sp.]|uniref:YqaA family protein n=1 Tax=Candidatus Pelagibacter sp. TaxID=2024849 RepID=UPI003F87780A
MLAYLSLFIISFLAATIFPFSSEAILATYLLSETHNKFLLIFFASFGNILGSIFNWFLGIYFLKFQNKKWFPFSKTQIDRSSKWFKKYGKWSLLFAWVPIIGDPLTFIAGTMRIKFLIFLLLVSFGKIMRYFVISLLV